MEIDLRNLVFVFIKQSRWKPSVDEVDDDGNNLFHLACQANQPNLIEVLSIKSRIYYYDLSLKNIDGYAPFELISSPSVSINRLIKSYNFYNNNILFKPGSIQHFIWFCKNITERRLIYYLLTNQHVIKWDHKIRSDCCTKYFILHLPDHPAFYVLLEICLHREAMKHLSETEFDISDENDIVSHCYITKVVDCLMDTSFEGNTCHEELLYAACKQSKYHFVNCLLSIAKCDPNYCHNGVTLLHVTTNPDIMQILFQHGVNVQLDDVKKLIRISTKVSHFSSAFEFLQKNGEWCPNLKLDFNGNTALHFSVQYRNIIVTEFLLMEYGCDPNAKNFKSKTPLDLATNSEIMQILVQNGANIKPENIEKLFSLATKEHPISIETMQILVQNGANIKPENIEKLFSLATKEHPISIETLKILRKAKLWYPDSVWTFLNDTALHRSARHQAPEVVHFLLTEVKCDPNIKNGESETLLQLVVPKWASQPEIIDVIKDLVTTKQWDPNSSCNYKGDTALHLSAKYHKPEVVLFLLTEVKCDPSFKNLLGETLLQLMIPTMAWTSQPEKIMTTNPGPTSYRWFGSECIEVIKVLIATEHWDANSSCNSIGDTALHLSVKHYEHRLVCFLLSEAKCDPNSKNFNDETPLQVTNDAEIINDLIRYGSNPNNVYKLYGKSIKLKKPLEPPVKIFIVGNSGVGKSTLTEALKIEVPLLTRAFSTRRRVSDVDEKTAGIVPHNFKSKNYGRVTLYDFAGHREFYSSHAAFLQNVIQGTSPVFLVVVNISVDNDIIQQNILYWLSFVENQCSVVNCISHVFVIGSHADIVISSGEDPQHKAYEMSRSINKIFESLTVKYDGIYPMDCQYAESPGMNRLRNHLTEICNAIRIPEMIPFNAHCFQVFLLDKFRLSVAVIVQDIQDKIVDEQNTKEGIARFLPDTVSSICKVCDELNKRGHILFLKNYNDNKNSWVIIDKARLLSRLQVQYLLQRTSNSIVN